MITAEAKQWIAIGAIFLLVALFIGRMNSAPPLDDTAIIALTAQPASVMQVVAQDALFPTPTYTLAFADGVAVVLSPVYGMTATPTPLIAPENIVASNDTLAIASSPMIPTISAQNSVASTMSDSNRLHEIVRGDTLYQIAVQYEVRIEDLLQANGLSEDSTIYAGQTLIIPAGNIDIDSVVAVIATPMATTAPTVIIPSDAIAVINATPHTPRENTPKAMNGLAYDAFVFLAADAEANIRRIFTQGQIMGRNARSFTRLGDSTIESPYFMTRFDSKGDYNLGEYGFLQDVIDYYAGSFAHESVAIKRGLHTWSVFDPLWANSSLCGPNENLLACEIRRSNPSIIFVRLGSNDAGVPDSTERNLRRVIEYCIEQGVIPIMGTKADRFEGSNINNEIIRRLANEYQVPLWDFDVVAGMVPGRGLGSDHVHMTSFFAHDWTLAEAWTRGHGVHNLSALIMLDAVWEALQRHE